MSAQSPQSIPQEHLDILKNSGLLNPNISLEQVISAATELNKFPAQSQASVPTLIGPFYIYHAVEAMEEATSSAG